MTSIMYKFPKAYNLFLKIIHGNNLSERYKIISKIIGKNKRVLDLGCGTCLLFNYLDKSCSYQGWDLNKNFINKNKNNLNVKLKNVFDYKDYPENDVIVISDLLHHVVPRHDELVKKAKKKTKKLIIIEPTVGINIIGTKNKFLKIVNKLIDKILSDDDGINSFEDRSKWFEKKEDVYKFFMKFNPKLIKEIGLDYIVVLE
ncbi:MAG: methyltransferase domain-containing protein [Candidatus Hodarchaeota archaeon]